MRAGMGPAGAVLLSLFVCCAALSTINASIFTGARVYHALGQDLVGALAQLLERAPATIRATPSTCRARSRWR